MTDRDELLQRYLASLEAGTPLDEALSSLSDEELEPLIKLAAAIRAMPHPEPASDTAQFQRRVMPAARPALTSPQRRWGWALPAAFLGVAALLIFMLVASVLVGAVWLWRDKSAPIVAPNPSSATQVALQASDPHSGVLRDVRGVVEVQAPDGTWQPAEAGQEITVGQRLRTGALSGATLAFYDGSQARLGPESEVSVDSLDAQTSGPRMVRLTQWRGDTDHQVTPSSDAASRYEVATPSGVGTAKGTAFHVLVTSALLVRFDVDEGAVAVTHLNVTVIVVAGQSTIILADHPPEPPVFRITGEGEVEQTGTAWRIAGQAFVTDDNTAIIGNPQVGDWVAFAGRIRADGTYLADRIVLLRPATTNKFAFAGTVEVIGATEWTIAGRAVRVDEQTLIEAGIAVGDVVEVKGGIADNGTLWAARISRVEVEEPGIPFKFTGVVESTTEALWAVSGISITVEARTQIQSGIRTGDVVNVAGRIRDDGTWLAKSIRRAEAAEREFEMSGVVESIDPWIVAGVRFEAAAGTEIDEGIAVGDRVRVEGQILEDGTWLAARIKRLEATGALRFEFVGRVTSVNPWVVRGVALVVNEDTKIEGNIAVGDLARVKGRILPDGTWLAGEIKRVKPGRGCLDTVVVVRSLDAGRVVLLNGQVIPLDQQINVQGEIKVASVVIVRLCVGDDGTTLVVGLTLIYQLETLPVVVVGCPGIQVVVVSNGQFAMPNGRVIQLGSNTWIEIKLSGKGDRVEIKLNGHDPKVEVKVKSKEQQVEVKPGGKGKDKIAVVGAGKYSLSGTVVVQACMNQAGPLFTVSGAAFHR